MRIKTLKALAAVVMLTVAANFSFAGSFDTLVDRLVDQEVFTASEGQLLKIEIREDSRKKLAQGKVSTIPAWIQNMQFKGDLRVRHQSDWPGKSGADIRIRDRIRFRLALETKLMEKFKVGARLATGSEGLDGSSVVDKESTSTNHTLGQSFGKARLMLDYAWLKYDINNYMSLTGGKMKAKTQAWTVSDLLWDGDVNPDGLALNINKNLGNGVSFFGNASWLILSDDGKDSPTMYIIQPGVNMSLSENASLKFAVAYQKMDVSGKDLWLFGTPAVNYYCYNPGVELKINKAIAGYTVKFFGDYVTNSADGVDEDKDGYLAGICFGHKKVSGFGTWQLKYMLRHLEANAWLNKLGDSDAYGGSTNAEGYEVALSYGLAKNTSLGIDYYAMNKITGTSAPKSLIQIDIVQKF